MNWKLLHLLCSWPGYWTGYINIPVSVEESTPLYRQLLIIVADFTTLTYKSQMPKKIEKKNTSQETQFTRTPTCNPVKSETQHSNHHNHRHKFRH